jgi:hypothetical protein
MEIEVEALGATDRRRRGPQRDAADRFCAQAAPQGSNGRA